MPQRVLTAMASMSRCWKLKSRRMRWQEAQEKGEAVPLKQELPDVAKLPLWLLHCYPNGTVLILKGQGRAASSLLQRMLVIRIALSFCFSLCEVV